VKSWCQLQVSEKEREQERRGEGKGKREKSEDKELNLFLNRFGICIHASAQEHEEYDHGRMAAHCRLRKSFSGKSSFSFSF
jgi:hypothetical protein